jgi:GT2 family glycosyltransferase
MTTLSVIILTYNSEKHITKCLESVLEVTRVKLDADEAEILIYDNNSSDKTVDTVKAFIRTFNTKNIRITKSSENLGFAKGINTAASIARGEYMLFLNPDSELTNDKITDMIRQFDTDSKIAVIGGKITDFDNKEENSAGKFYSLVNLFIMVLGLEEQLGIRFSPKKITDVDFVSGGFMMVRKDYFEKLNGFDEQLFMYVEDMEFCFRIKKAGLRILFYPNAIIRHIGQASSSRSFAIVQIYQGLLYFYKKHTNQFEYFIAKLLLITKARIAIMVGSILNKKDMVATYSKALQTIQ